MFLLFFAVGFMFMDRLSINFLFPFMHDEFSLTSSRIGILTSALSLTWAVSGYVFGSYADAKGYRRLVLISAVILFSLGSFLSGLAPTFLTLLAARALMGLAEGPVLPISQSLMMQASSESRRGFNMGFIQASAAGLLGSVAAPAILVPLANAYGWRNAFYVAGIPGIVVGLLLFILVHEPEGNENKIVTSETISRIQATKAIFSKNTALCVLMGCLVITWFLAILTFAPAFLIEYRHFRPSEMGFIMTVLGVSTVIGGSAVPWLSDRVGRKPALFLFSTIGAFAPLVVAYLDCSLFLLCVAIALSFLSYGCFPIVLCTIPAESVPTRYVSRAMAAVIGIAEIIGGVISPTVVGSLADQYGAQTPFIIASICSVGAACVTLFLKETAPLKMRGVACSVESSDEGATRTPI